MTATRKYDTERLATLILAPVGSCRLMFPHGEEAAARAAGEAGIICTLSTLSGCRLEDVATASGGPVWYQLYLVGGRDCALAGIDRARKAGFLALVVTIDTPIAGFRERDLRNGAKELLTGKLGPMLPFVNQLLVRPRWLTAFLADGGLMKFENVVIPGKGPMLYADVTAALEQSVVTWDDLKWIRQAWNGPIVIKGIHTAEDARRAVDLLRAPSRRRPVFREQPARRHESRRQGVRCRTRRRAGRAHPVAIHRRIARAARGPDRQSVRRRPVRGGPACRADDAGRPATRADALHARGRPRVQRVPLGGADADGRRAAPWRRVFSRAIRRRSG